MASALEALWLEAAKTTRAKEAPLIQHVLPIGPKLEALPQGGGMLAVCVAQAGPVGVKSVPVPRTLVMSWEARRTKV
jgi:hypothetical protein